jgi:pimeloyl-ACP methyl ester carboxylesterase
VNEHRRTKRAWTKIFRIWGIAGGVAMGGFLGWCLLAYRASDDARRALASDEQVSVRNGEGYRSFAPNIQSNLKTAGLVFFAGSLVEPAAYAPLAQAVARKGNPVLLIELPWRGTFGGADGRYVIDRARAAMRRFPQVRSWVIAGHSRGGEVAARFVNDDIADAAGLVLIGTSHPRRISLANITVPVAKILGTRDGIAPVIKSKKTRNNLPSSTRWVLIEGGNHSQFGSYGFQPGDRVATISRHDQQESTVAVLLKLLRPALLPDRISTGNELPPNAGAQLDGGPGTPQ